MKEWLSIVVINWLTRRAAAESSNYGDGVDGAHLGIECAMMVVVKAIHQRSAVHEQEYTIRFHCHHWDRSGEEGLSGSRR
jgi:hypothetical protein